MSPVSCFSSYICTDHLSGIANCFTNSTVATGGQSQIVNARVTDNAGNTTAHSLTLNIDTTPPVLCDSVLEVRADKIDQDVSEFVSESNDYPEVAQFFRSLIQGF